ncbi:two-component regulator propeller domain-containing protein [Flavobacterium sp.]|uniref:type IX secretion system anionic LPS delivery protein PorZ n=1 Tax=Flavobacterium sp. TaxID=239 RepID=UPI0026341849|nr:two-component regulator propeller domain-containing protein [Flavobacterium sp.]
MSKKIINLLSLLLIVSGFAQTNLQWQGYFSYNKISDISEGQDKIYASSENAIFSKNLVTNDITTTTSIDGLKAETITAIHYSETFNKTLVGNSNGLLLILNPDGKIIFKNGIVVEVPVSPFLKKINHFLEFNGKVYLSCDYGISVFDLTTMEFGDTYFIGNSGQQVKVYQTTILNNEIFAVTDINGIKKAALSNPNLVDFSQWQVFDGGFWSGITTIQNILVGMNTNGRLYKNNGTFFEEFFILNQGGIDIRTSNEMVSVTTQSNVHIFNPALQLVVTINNSQYTPTPVTFSCASVIDDVIYIGTNETGLLVSNLSAPTNFQSIKPDGPDRNNIFRIKQTSNTLWATYGGYSITYDPSLLEEGISKYSRQNGWSKIPFTDLFGATSLSDIVVNPKNENEVYVCSFHNGLLKIKDDAITFYNQNTAPPNGPENQQLVTPAYISVRINGPAFDSSGNLWMTNAYVFKALKTLKPDNTWQSVNDWPNQLASANEERYSKIAIDRNNTKWVPTYRGNGLVAFNENYANKFIKIKTGTDGNLPSNDVRTVAIDNKNQVWIGTARGLRFIPSADSFVSETEIQSKPIIILEDDLAQELFFEQFIMEIVVDGANRKWVSIAESGVYLISPNGQETIYQFTKDNSPLPSNNVNDIEIDSVTGEVFFATDKGLVSFKGTATRPSEDLSNVYAYPNPVRPGFSGTVKISGLTNKAVVKITDIEGNLVHETTSEGGTIEWDTTAFGKYKVATGVYMILVSAEDGIDTIVKKVMIVR